ncbi:DUF732 domain-containing protein [Mycobacterium sp. Aquia_213]|uniref:DUF732 domain-containing protein n=1 Tax=Mycobacterium sp. Aquia_213 TaxID=2991728 RepID=UPI002271E3D1|nr:DUF732 domain-containing protein [Mycobacterium sp. Aquia_213]WAC90564.1 DUF732 domain-containing protein [Mycobacterium sp. Aquia_213]
MKIGKPGPLRVPSGTRLVVAIAVSLGVLGAGVAPAAHADAADDKFIQLLISDGITHDSVPAAIAAARKVCEYLGQGMSPNEVVIDVMNSSSLPDYDAGYFVGAAIRAYCPQYKPPPEPAPPPPAPAA